jgi:hypothetical protein
MPDRVQTGGTIRMWLKNYYIEITGVLVFIALFYFLTSGQIMELGSLMAKPVHHFSQHFY